MLKGAEDVELSEDVLALWREYRYRQLFPMSHSDYLEEPRGVIEWMMQLDTLAQKVMSDGG